LKSLWDRKKAAKIGDDLLGLRVYTSRLLGREPDLVLHGGGNTSVKMPFTDIFGDTEELLYVKGSGWDLETIEAAGFAPVKMSVLTKMAELETLTDSDMVKLQRAAMVEPSAPNPSVEAVLHAIIPFRFVDHTHADAVVTMTNTETGDDRIRDLYGKRILLIPYVMPGFVLAQKVFEMTRDLDWSSIDGMILMNHGVFTFDDDARKSYEKMIALVSEAEGYLKENTDRKTGKKKAGKEDLFGLAKWRQAVSLSRGEPVVVSVDRSSEALSFSGHDDVASISQRGPLTPDHVIRTKRVPIMMNGVPAEGTEEYAEAYMKYFDKFSVDGLDCLDLAPRWGIWAGHGVVAFGRSKKEARIISDITGHTIKAIADAEALGGWQALPSNDIFDVEYWELEQAKLKKQGAAKPLQGKIALVTGAAGGIGYSCVRRLNEQGAAVVALDIKPAIETLYSEEEILGLTCDVTDSGQLKAAVETVVREFGGLDIVVGNAGTFPAGQTIGEMKSETWEKSLALNLTSYQVLLKESIPYLSVGCDPAIVIVASKNVPAPGPGASAYSVAKAGLTQLARVAALELGSAGVRVNVVHPNGVFDTSLWSHEILQKRAESYGLSVEEYKTNNILKVEVTSRDVGDLVCAMAGPLFGKTTGCQIPIDGGNDRVI